MDKKFYTRMRKIRLYALAESVLVICSGSSVIIAIAAWKRFRLLSVLSIFVFAVSGLLLFFMNRRKQTFGMNTMPIRHESLETIVASLRAKELFDHTFFSFLNDNRISVRILLQYTPSFCKESIANNRRKANSIINKKYNISEKVPFEKAAHSMRLNLVICETENDELNRWIMRDAGKLMSRAESILNMAIVLDRYVALFPECAYGAYFSEIRRYCTAIRLIEQSLGTDNEKACC